MSKLFRKAAVATDLHLGLKSNSITHNEDCVEFIEWFCKKAKEEDCDIAIICGDWHNHRSSISIQTLNYSMKCLDILNKNFSQVFMITGNHDQFYRESREIHSLAWGDYLKNVQIVNDIITIDDVTICPWLIGEELKKVRKIKSTYTFGHFELPNFYMNAQVLMPGHGEIGDDDFSNTGTVFSGHFHKRQARKNIWYIGNAFPHNYADAGDDQRGMMILEWGHEPEFHAWPGQPLFRNYKLSQVLDNPAGLLLKKSSVKIHLDIAISYEEANFIREELIPQYGLREMSLIPTKTNGLDQDIPEDQKFSFDNPDKIITEQLTKIESDFFDPKLLLEIYRKL